MQSSEYISILHAYAEVRFYTNGIQSTGKVNVTSQQVRFRQPVYKYRNIWSLQLKLGIIKGWDQGSEPCVHHVMNVSCVHGLCTPWPNSLFKMSARCSCAGCTGALLTVCLLLNLLQTTLRLQISHSKLKCIRLYSFPNPGAYFSVALWALCFVS